MRLQSITTLLQSLERRVVSVTAFVVLLAMYSLTRVVFFVANRPIFSSAGPTKILACFIHGMRFDLAALSLCNAPVIAFVAFAGLTRGKARLVLARLTGLLFAIVNIPALVLNVIDAGWFPFNGRRATLSSFAITLDIKAQTGQVLIHFWPLTIFGVMLTAGIIWLAIGLSRRIATGTPAAWWRRLIWAVAAAGLVILGIRGGFQLKPLATAHANVFPDPALASLILNTPFNIYHGLKRKPLRGLPVQADWSNVLAVVSQPPHRHSFVGQRRDNVVILIMESCGSGFSRLFSGDPNAPDCTPFLDSLAQQGLYFTNGFANGRRSIEAVSSILAGLPSLMDEPFIASPFCNSPLDPLPARLARAGYTTAFFHGARNGTMMFDLFARFAGIQHYFGMNEYPNRTDYDGSWGIFDEPYLKYCVNELSKLHEPFQATIFTLTAHNPYPIPPQYRARFTGGPTKMHDSIAYADFALSQFFQLARTQPWFTNTLFILTADHATEHNLTRFTGDLALYRVPIVIFHGGGTVPAHSPARVAQHADIQPTVLDFLGMPLTTANYFGRSLFDESFPGRALNHAAGTYWLVKPGFVMRWTASGKADLLSWDTTDLNTANEIGRDTLKQSMLTELQMFILYFNRGLTENRLAPH